MLITLPRMMAEAADGLDDSEFLLYDHGDPLDPRLEETTFLVPSYMTARAQLPMSAQMPRLKVVQLLTAGFDGIPELLPPGVTLCNAKGVHDASTAELAVGLALASVRGLDGFARSQMAGRWERVFRPSLADRTVLLLGYGSIGSAIEDRLRPFEVEIVRVAHHARLVPAVFSIEELPRLLPRADVVILILPLTAETRHMVDDSFLSMMKEGASLVNVARGPIVDTDALVGHLERGRIRAALDVTDPEPLPEGHPLWAAPNCLISPHVGGDTTAFKPRGLELLRRNIDRYRASLPLLNVVRH